MRIGIPHVGVAKVVALQSQSLLVKGQSIGLVALVEACAAGIIQGIVDGGMTIAELGAQVDNLSAQGRRERRGVGTVGTVRADALHDGRGGSRGRSGRSRGIVGRARHNRDELRLGEVPAGAERIVVPSKNHVCVALLGYLMDGNILG